MIYPKIISKNTKYIRIKSDIHHNYMTTSDDKDDIDIFWYCKKYVGKNSREKKKIKNIKFLMLGSDT